MFERKKFKLSAYMTSNLWFEINQTDEIVNRPLTPEDIAKIPLDRLRVVPGIGAHKLCAITRWMEEAGYEVGFKKRSLRAWERANSTSNEAQEQMNTNESCGVKAMTAHVKRTDFYESARATLARAAAKRKAELDEKLNSPEKQRDELLDRAREAIRFMDYFLAHVEDEYEHAPSPFALEAYRRLKETVQEIALRR